MEFLEPEFDTRRHINVWVKKMRAFENRGGVGSCAAWAFNEGLAMDEQQQTDNPIGMGSTINADSTARRVDFKIPVAVFTAKRGYDWTRLPSFTTLEEVERIYEEVGALKADFQGDLSLGDVFKGVILKPNFAFAFRLQIVEKWDQAKRDANYCAAAFVPLEHLADVDFDRLLDMDYFSVPSRSPDDTLRYVDEDYTEPEPHTWEPVLQNFIDGNLQDFSWCLIGPMLARYRAGNSMWVFARMACKSEMRHKIKLGEWDGSAPCFQESDTRSQQEILTYQTYQSCQESVQTASKTDISEASPKVESYAPVQQQGTNVQSIDDSTTQRLQYAEEQILALNQTIDALKRMLDKQAKTIETKSLELAAAQRQAAECKKYLNQYDLMNIREMKPNESKVDWLYPSLTFLLGVLFAGVIFLAINYFDLWGHSSALPEPGKVVEQSSVSDMPVLTNERKK